MPHKADNDAADVANNRTKQQAKGHGHGVGRTSTLCWNLYAAHSLKGSADFTRRSKWDPHESPTSLPEILPQGAVASNRQYNRADYRAGTMGRLNSNAILMPLLLFNTAAVFGLELGSRDWVDPEEEWRAP